MKTEKPNIICIMSDEHDVRVTGCYGDPIVETPNLDRLAREGVTFDACYTTSPLCVPARLSFTAGKYISGCGAWSNNCHLPSPDYPSLPRIMETAGYEAYLCGKMHYQSDRRYGFRDLIPDDNQHQKTGLGGRRAPDDTEAVIQSWQSRISQFYTGTEKDSQVLRMDLRRTKVAKEFLLNRKEDDKPFFLMLGYLSPHFPLIIPESYYRKYKDRVPMPELPDNWFERLPTNYQQLIIGFGVDRDDQEIVKLGRELYWGFVEWMDDQIGQVLSALKDSGIADNTIVIYTSDHGENKGDHGMWWKNNMFEHSARIPLIMHYPRRWQGGQRRTGACSLVDLVQTIGDITGAEIPEDWNGDSMLNWLDNPETEWKDLAISEYYAHNISSGFTMLRQGPYKYVYHTRMNAEYGPERELYNLDEDPFEWNNLAGSPNQQERLVSMHQLMVSELGGDPEEFEKQCRLDYQRGYE